MHLKKNPKLPTLGTGDMAHVVESLLSKLKVLSLIPSTAKKEKKNLYLGVPP
jgi:hypothetical protein